LLGKRLLGVWAGLVAAMLYLLNDLQLVYAQQARSYSLQLLLICIAWYALLAALTADFQQRRWWFCFVVATVLAIYAHLFSLIILLSQACACAGMLLLPQPWRGKSRRQLPALLISLGAIFLSITPELAHLNLVRTSWLPRPYLIDILRLLLAISGSNRLYLFALAACCGAGLLAALLISLPKGVAEPADKARYFTRVGAGGDQHLCFLPAGLAFLCWMLVPLVVSYMSSQGPVHLFSSRYLVTIVPSLCLLAGMGVATLRWQSVQVVITLLLLALALYAVPFYYRSAQVEDWGSTSLWLEQHYQVGDGLVCYDNALEQGCQISIEYYLHAYPGAAHFDPDSPGAFSWHTFSSVNPDAAVDPQVLAVYASRHARLFFIVGRLPDDAAASRALAAQEWLDSHYHFIAQIATRTVRIRLYAT
jgi:mannosyltransferase